MICNICKLDKGLEDFSTLKKGKMYRCKACSAARARGAFRITQEIIRKWKSRPCTDCGIRYDYWMMDADHLPGTIKKYNVSTSSAYRSIELELAKCEVVCANCHRNRTYRRNHVDL